MKKWWTPEGYVRASQIRQTAVTLQVLGLIKFPITPPTLKAWTDAAIRGESLEGKKNQPAHHRHPFPVKPNEFKTYPDGSVIYPQWAVFQIIAQHEANMNAAVKSPTKLALKLEREYKRYTRRQK